MMEEGQPTPAGPAEPTNSAASPVLPLRADWAVRGSPPPVKLEIYEGPLDLLLDLIRKQQINIYDIPIAQITRQYLDYLHMLEALNIDVASEFVLMAATLIYIKSRMLLPPDPTAPPEQQEDPRTELVHRLLEHEKFKNAAQMLESKRMLEEAMWTQPGIGEFAEAEDEPGVAVSLFDLISAFREILERAKKRAPLAIQREKVTVGEMMEHVRQVLLSTPHAVRLDDLASAFDSREALIALLLALLEMVRLRAIVLRQKELFAPITIHRSKHFEEVLARASASLLEASLEELAEAAPEGNAEGSSHAE
jgi:segregation and condensation protein A